MNYIDRLLLENRAWVNETQARDPEFYARLGEGQAPDALWIGCSDSRVPPEQLCNATPGQLFIYRNVANVACIDEPGFLSVLEYAVKVLKVPHIVVCGHHGCGGVGAACSSEPVPLEHVREHLDSLVDLRQKNDAELAKIKDEQARVNHLVELNVCDQIERLSGLPLLREADKPPQLHGLVYVTAEGLLHSVSEPQAEQRQAAVA